MSTVTLCVGIPASGKSTWAREESAKTGAIIICRDEVRISLGLEHGDDEHLVTVVSTEMLEEAIAADQDIIIADTNINPRTRSRLTIICGELGADVDLKIFRINLKEAIRRDTNRLESVGEAVILRMWQNMEKQDFSDYEGDSNE